MIIDGYWEKEDEGHIYWTCHFCSRAVNGRINPSAQVRARSLVCCPFEYKQLILKQDPVALQLLSVVDTTLAYSERMASFARGHISPAPVLSAPLIDFNAGERLILNKSSAELFEMLGVMKLSNPIIQNYKTMLERPHLTYGVPIVTEDDVAEIFDCVRAKDPRTQFSDVSDQPPMHLGIAFQLPPDASMMAPNTAPNAHLSNQEVGQAERRSEQEQMDIDQQGIVLVAVVHCIHCAVLWS